MHAGIPQIAMAYPEYEKINNRYKIAVLLDHLSVNTVAATINQTLNDDALLAEMHLNAIRAREIYCWQNEEGALTGFYKKVFNE